jgi:hypothetical protein
MSYNQLGNFLPASWRSATKFTKPSHQTIHQSIPHLLIPSRLPDDPWHMISDVPAVRICQDTQTLSANRFIQCIKKKEMSPQNWPQKPQHQCLDPAAISDICAACVFGNGYWNMLKIFRSPASLGKQEWIHTSSLTRISPSTFARLTIPCEALENLQMQFLLLNFVA